jgi:hypothetical protein
MIKKNEKQKEIMLVFESHRFDFEILIDDKLYIEPQSKALVSLNFKEDFNLKIRSLQYKYGKLRYSRLILNLDITAENIPSRITTDGINTYLE